MAEPYTPQPVMPVGAIMRVPGIPLDTITGKLKNALNSEIIHSKGFSVQEFTNYYNREMGSEIIKHFYYADCLHPLEGSAEWKHRSNAIENSFREEASSARPVNIDPGYLTEAKLVLFSMKGYAHRIYIRDGVYGEVTLQYVNGAFRSLPWTYGDYQSEFALNFWREARESLRERLKK